MKANISLLFQRRFMYNIVMMLLRPHISNTEAGLHTSAANEYIARKLHPYEDGFCQLAKVGIGKC